MSSDSEDEWVPSGDEEDEDYSDTNGKSKTRGRGKGKGKGKGRSKGKDSDSSADDLDDDDDNDDDDDDDDAPIIEADDFVFSYNSHWLRADPAPAGRPRPDNPQCYVARVKQVLPDGRCQLLWYREGRAKRYQREPATEKWYEDAASLRLIQPAPEAAPGKTVRLAPDVYRELHDWRPVAQVVTGDGAGDGDDDDDDDDDDVDDGRGAGDTQQRAPTSSARRRKHGRRVIVDSDDDDDDDDNDDHNNGGGDGELEYDDTKVSSKGGAAGRRSSSSSSSSSSSAARRGGDGGRGRGRTLPPPDRNDEITDEKLEHPHVCWSSPDGSSEMFFNLSTLRKIAISLGKGEWRQPPHFREPMERSLRRQIEVKFGKKALVIARPSPSSFGGRGAGGWGGGGDDDDEDEYEFGDDGDDGFRDTLLSWMGHRIQSLGDVYVCPICYTWLSEDLLPKQCDPINVLVHRPSRLRLRRLARIAERETRRAERAAGGEEEEEEEGDDDDDDDDDDNDDDEAEESPPKPPPKPSPKPPPKPPLKKPSSKGRHTRRANSSHQVL